MARRQTNRLTAAEVRTAKPGPKPRYLADGNGLMLRVTLSGSKQWIQRIMVNGKRRDRGLGGYPLVSLAEAREVAFDNRKRARRGEDPQPEPKRRQQGPTFSEAQAVVLEQKRPTWKNATAARNWETTMRDYVVPRIGDLHVNDDMLDTPQVDDVLRPIAEAGKKATCKALAPRIRAVTQWAAIRGRMIPLPLSCDSSPHCSMARRGTRSTPRRWTTCCARSRRPAKRRHARRSPLAFARSRNGPRYEVTAKTLIPLPLSCDSSPHCSMARRGTIRRYRGLRWGTR